MISSKTSRIWLSTSQQMVIKKKSIRNKTSDALTRTQDGIRVLKRGFWGFTPSPEVLDDSSSLHVTVPFIYKSVDLGNTVTVFAKLVMFLAICILNSWLFIIEVPHQHLLNSSFALVVVLRLLFPRHVRVLSLLSWIPLFYTLQSLPGLCLFFSLLTAP